MEAEDVATALREAGDLVLPAREGASLVPPAEAVRGQHVVDREWQRVFRSTGMVRQDQVVAAAAVGAAPGGAGTPDRPLEPGHGPGAGGPVSRAGTAPHVRRRRGKEGTASRKKRVVRMYGQVRVCPPKGAKNEVTATVSTVETTAPTAA